MNDKSLQGEYQTFAVSRLCSHAAPFLSRKSETHAGAKWYARWGSYRGSQDA
jgi:hypothetical protein